MWEIAGAPVPRHAHHPTETTHATLDQTISAWFIRIHAIHRIHEMNTFPPLEPIWRNELFGSGIWTSRRARARRLVVAVGQGSRQKRRGQTWTPSPQCCGASSGLQGRRQAQGRQMRRRTGRYAHHVPMRRFGNDGHYQKVIAILPSSIISHPMGHRATATAWMWRNVVGSNSCTSSARTRHLYGMQAEESGAQETEGSKGEQGEGKAPPLPITTTLMVDGASAVVNHTTMEVACADEALRGRVQRALKQIHNALLPIDIGC